MRSRRWDLAAHPNVGAPDPLFPIPNAYDIKLNLIQGQRIVQVGPLLKRNPQSPFSYARVKWTANDIVEPYNFQERIQFQYPTGGVKRIYVDYFTRSGVLIVPTQFLVTLK